MEDKLQHETNISCVIINFQILPVLQMLESCWLHLHIFKSVSQKAVNICCVLSTIFEVCISQMQDALLSQLCSSAVALCAATAIHQESKEQTASLD